MSIYQKVNQTKIVKTLFCIHFPEGCLSLIYVTILWHLGHLNHTLSSFVVKYGINWKKNGAKKVAKIAFTCHTVSICQAHVTNMRYKGHWRDIAWMPDNNKHCQEGLISERFHGTAIDNNNLSITHGCTVKITRDKLSTTLMVMMMIAVIPYYLTDNGSAY